MGDALGRFTRPGRLRRGQLEIFVSNSAIMQELGFEKQRILGDLQRGLPEAYIRDLRFRIGTIQ